MKIKGEEIPVCKIPFRVANRIKRMLYGFYLDRKVVDYLAKWQHVNHDIERIIRVGFLVQDPTCWDKVEPIYDSLNNNPRFDAKLVVVPNYDFVNKTLKTEYIDNFYITNYPDAIRAFNNAAWVDLTKCFDYIFYPCPYDVYLPEEYRSDNLVKYMRCCYIPYGFSGAINFDSGNSNKDFFRNMYITFTDSDYTASLLKKNFIVKKEKEVHRIESLGYPALKAYFFIKPSKESKRILWTPRWSYDPLIGGSHFNEYRDIFIMLKDIYPDSELTFRPHPLLFEELILKSIMSRKEIETYLNSLTKNNIRYDASASLFNTLSNTDILITDYSSIIIQFFITGRPIIYCESKNIKLNNVYLKLFDGMYIAKNEEDILKFMKDLKNGNDYLFDKRQQIIRDYLQLNHFKATENIVNYIEQDFCKK